MSFQHQGLAEGGWERLTFLEQMANIGSEVERALNWRAKKNPAYSQKAVERALELLDLSLTDKQGMSRLKELARLREAIVDFFWGNNEFRSSEASYRKYFFYLTYAARKNL